MSLDQELDEIAQLFIEESMEGLAIMETGLLNLDLGAADPETMNSIFRAAHSIKGGGATFGYTDISEFAHHVETLLDEMRQGERPVTREGVDLTLQSVDCIRDMINDLGKGDVDTTRAKELEAELTVMLQSDAAPLKPEGVSSKPSANNSESGDWEIYYKPAKNSLKSNSDPLRMLQQLKQLGDLVVCSEGADDLKFGEYDSEECQLAWHLTLTGEVGRDEIEEVFAWKTDECELKLTLLSSDIVDTPPSTADSTKQSTTEEAASTDVTETPKKPPVKSAAKSSGGQENSSIRVNIAKVDALINLVGELVITQSMLSRFNSDFQSDQLEALREGLTQLSRNTRELQESVMAIRMLPISFAFSRFPRLVRDTGNALGKNVELKLTGENTELDKTVLEKIGDPLVHLVRNSLDHGLEMPEAREAAGKPATGVLELNAYHEGGNIIIEVIDDGAGINKERVLQKAREQGLVGADEQLSDDRINNLIFMAGFSTVDEISDLSGRGVGMDVVRRNIADLGGNVSVHSETGKGSKFTIKLPLTLAILDGQLVRVGKESYIIPLVSIVETIQTTADQVNELAGATELFKLREEYLPVLRLHKIFSLQADSVNINDGLLVVAEANGQRIGILVDDLLEQQQIVIKSLEANYRQTPGISGATILGDGTVALILDVPGLLQLFMERQNSASTPIAAAA
ncbi:MAG: chemotaxis protein CheA [Acidiferrobacterales bacterium]|nr:chemotaxis protein CheA [Acidiferrobacterales bacterium]